MTNDVNIVESPMTRWAFGYRKRFGYVWGGSMVFLGIITLPIFGIGLAFLIPGILILYFHHKHHSK